MERYCLESDWWTIVVVKIDLRGIIWRSDVQGRLVALKYLITGITSPLLMVLKIREVRQIEFIFCALTSGCDCLGASFIHSSRHPERSCRWSIEWWLLRKQGSESVTRTRIHFQTGKVTFKICSRSILEWIFLISSRHSPRRNWDQILKETRVLILNLIQICSRYILINKFKISSRYNLREYGKHIQNISQIFSGIKSERNGEEILNLFFIYH